MLIAAAFSMTRLRFCTTVASSVAPPRLIFVIDRCKKASISCDDVVSVSRMLAVKPISCSTDTANRCASLMKATARRPP